MDPVLIIALAYGGAMALAAGFILPLLAAARRADRSRDDALRSGGIERPLGRRTARGGGAGAAGAGPLPATFERERTESILPTAR